MSNIEEKINVSICFYSILRNLAGIDHVDLEIKDKSLINLIDIVQDQYFDKNDVELYHHDEINQSSINPEIIILINDVDYRIFGKIEDYILKNNDKIVLISSVHGG